MKNDLKTAAVLLPMIGLLLWPTAVDAQQRRRGGRAPDVFKFLADKYDANSDGKLTKEEYDRSEENFQRFDTNKDGVLSADDWSDGKAANRSRGRQRHAGGSAAPSEGEQAPDFTLTHVLDDKKEVQLSSFAGSKPVALIFGSCT